MTAINLVKKACILEMYSKSRTTRKKEIYLILDVIFYQIFVKREKERDPVKLCDGGVGGGRDASAFHRCINHDQVFLNKVSETE